MRLRGGPPGRRRVATVAAVIASGAVVTAAVAAGPVVYSEYSSGGDRENRLALADSAGDIRLPKTVVGATVSPDGQRIAQVGQSTSGKKLGSWLRVTSRDGSAPVTVVESYAPSPTKAPERVIGGRPVWSPDGTRVIVQTMRFGAERGVYGSTERLVCVVDTRACQPLGRAVPPRRDADAFMTDIVGWQATDGPLLWRAPVTNRSQTVRCGSVGSVTRMPQATVTAIDPTSGFGPPLRLRGIPDSSSDDGLAGNTAGVAMVADGTLAYDLPDATVSRGRLHCGRDDATYRGSFETGALRLRLRTGGRNVILPRPPGLRRTDGATLVALPDGGAVLLSRPLLGGYRHQSAYCLGKGPRRTCYGEYFDDSSGLVVAGHPDGPVQRVWRYRPGARAFERVTGTSRAALRTLRTATAFTVADGFAILVVAPDTIERVPLDGGAPTTIARGNGASFELRDR